jgi:hypothetical protein
MRYALRAPAGYEFAQVHAVVRPPQASDERRTICGVRATNWPKNTGLTEVTCERCLRRLDAIGRLGT